MQYIKGSYTSVEKFYLRYIIYSVTIDEEGVTAAAYTELRLNGSARPPEDEIDFVVDHPFIFVITGTDSLPLFIGVVNNP